MLLCSMNRCDEHNVNNLHSILQVPAVENSVDPDLDLHCLSFSCQFISTIWIKTSDWLTVRNGCCILIYSA